MHPLMKLYSRSHQNDQVIMFVLRIISHMDLKKNPHAPALPPFFFFFFTESHLTLLLIPFH